MLKPVAYMDTIKVDTSQAVTLFEWVNYTFHTHVVVTHIIQVQPLLVTYSKAVSFGESGSYLGLGLARHRVLNHLLYKRC